jgi:hypothetical protein
VLGNFSNREKFKWRSLAKASQTCTSLRCTGLSGEQAGTPGEHASLGKMLGRCGYNSLDCPVCQLRAWPTAGHAISERHVCPANGHQVALDCPVRHRTVRCAMGPEVGNGLLHQTRKGITHCSLPGVHRTVRCALGQKAIRAFQMEKQRLLSPLGL